ncbi:MAG: SUMF1/EgtB/PvdO family nonheme iron enzyme [Xenococcus sp. (in: cyanobacteria)]
MTNRMRKKSEIQIFLAHAHEDKEAIFELYNRLKEAGYKPWLDKKDLIAGQNWRSVIPEAIQESQLFIACLSKRSIAKRGYVQNEFKMALNQMASLPAKSIYLIPVRLDECEIPNLRHEEYGIDLRDLHWLDYWESDGFAQLERAIAFQYGPFVQEREIADKIAEFEYVTVDETGREIKRETGQVSYYSEDLGSGISLDMVSIPGDKFMMGTEDEEIERLNEKYGKERFDNEKPQHEVTVQPFYMGRFQITQAQWKAIALLPKIERDLKLDPSHFKGDNRPVEQVSWYDAVEFCQRLSKRTGKEYRLPSEAEWEYACRAGTTTPFHFGEIIRTDLANYDDNYTYPNAAQEEHRGQTTPVGSFAPNPFGLYDMLGNVWEWCQDDWHDNYKGAPKNSIAWVSEDDSTEAIYQVMRGSSWFNVPDYCRSAHRIYFKRDDRVDDIGLRVVSIALRTT